MAEQIGLNENIGLSKSKLVEDNKKSSAGISSKLFDDAYTFVQEHKWEAAGALALGLGGVGAAAVGVRALRKSASEAAAAVENQVSRPGGIRTMISPETAYSDPRLVYKPIGEGKRLLDPHGYERITSGSSDPTGFETKLARAGDISTLKDPKSAYYVPTEKFAHKAADLEVLPFMYGYSEQGLKKFLDSVAEGLRKIEKELWTDVGANPVLAKVSAELPHKLPPR